uniref:DNA-directed RNA polymerase n=1 Tax=Phlebotomus papatasi TaxID=29031 RepID=A0A1B0D757_PHLPP
MPCKLPLCKKKSPNIVVGGLSHISRAVIAINDAIQPPTYQLCVEGSGLRDVMATYGVRGNHTKSNNIWEVFSTLGIEAARTTIMTEIASVMSGHGMSVDSRHIMLLASQMTSRGEVLGITRHVHKTRGFRIAGGGNSTVILASGPAMRHVASCMARSLNPCLSSGLFCLRQMQIHFISIEVSIVRCASTFIESERSLRLYLGLMAHNAEFVK